MARPSMQLILCVVIAAGVIFYAVQYLYQSKTIQYSIRCKDLQNVCKSQEQAISCGMLEECQFKWNLDRNKTKSKSESNITEKVDVKVYYESFCPHSKDFILKQLFPTFEKIYSSGIISLTLVPYGNAEERKKGDKWSFTCQHGRKECIGNLLETCAIHGLKTPKKWMPFVNCLENKGSIPENAVKCAKEQGFDYNIIETCVDGPVGNNLQHEMASKTTALKPSHTFIPWITINGKSTGLQKKALSDLLGLICSVYTGDKPEACKH